MGRGAIGFNLSIILNETDKEFDPYCEELLTGPLVWASFSVLFVSFGVPASTWLLSVLVQRQRDGQSNDIYMLNLTIMDLIFNMSVIPCLINYFFWQDYFLRQSTDFLFCLSVGGRPLFMAFTCVDCYIAVVHPITYIKMKDSKHRLVASALVWSLTLAYGLLFVDGHDLNFSRMTLFMLAFCLATISFCDIAILHTLRKPDPSGKTGVHPQKQRALQTITNSLIMTLVSYLAPMVVFGFSNLIRMVMPKQEVFCNIEIPTYIASTFGSAIMPLLYLRNLGKLKDLMRTFRFGCARRV